MFELPTGSIGTRALATAIVLRDSHVWGPCAVESLMADGATLTGRIDGDLSPGQATVVLAFSDSQLLKLEAVLHRIDLTPGDCQRCEVRFERCSPHIQDKIQQAVLEFLERSRKPWIVALDGGGLRQAHLHRDVRALGRETLMLSKPLEALWLVANPPVAFDTIIIDDSFVQRAGSRILAFLAERWPTKRRLLVCSSAEAESTRVQALRPLVAGILERPWTRAGFEMSLRTPATWRPVSAHRVLFVDDAPEVLAAQSWMCRDAARTKPAPPP